jgi:predicted 3-demethylubiquinone-9 3-methyltransferase (glyoxalase superfamily)
MTVVFNLNGQKYMALNGGPEFKFNESISFIINCDTQEEVDYFWEKLSAEGEKGLCGWLKDKYGVSWHVVPTILEELLSDPTKSENVMQVMLQMKKLDIAKLAAAVN